MDSVQALAVLVAAVLPGALYTWGFEREVGSWGSGMADRVLRFTGSSALFHALAAPVDLWVYRQFGTVWRAPGQPSWWLVWSAALAYVLLPLGTGVAVGVATGRGRRWARFVTGPAPQPRAWDHVFSRPESAWLRIRLKESDTEGEGCWLLGAYAPARDGVGSYAAGYGHGEDLYLADTAEADPETGHFVLGTDGRPVLRGVGVLIRWDEIRYIEVIRP
ncbi:DUF6338 family protein [Streptomyces sp. YKOK-I1]